MALFRFQLEEGRGTMKIEQNIIHSSTSSVFYVKYYEYVIRNKKNLCLKIILKKLVRVE